MPSFAPSRWKANETISAPFLAVSQYGFVVYQPLTIRNCTSGANRTLAPPWTLDLGPWTLDLGLWTLDLGLWTLDFPLRPPRLRAADKVRPVPRSAGFQPAVSPISNRQSVAITVAPDSSAHPQAGSLRYSRLETCATTLSLALHPLCRLLRRPRETPQNRSAPVLGRSNVERAGGVGTFERPRRGRPLLRPRTGALRCRLSRRLGS